MYDIVLAIGRHSRFERALGEPSRPMWGVLNANRTAFATGVARRSRPKPSTSLVKLDQNVAKVVEELNHGPVRGTKRTRTLWRECPVGSTRARLKLSMVSRVASEMAAPPLTGVKSTSRRPS